MQWSRNRTDPAPARPTFAEWLLRSDGADAGFRPLPSGRRWSGTSLVRFQNLVHDLIHWDAWLRRGAALVDDSQDALLLPLTVLTNDLNRHDGSNFAATPGDDGEFIVDSSFNDVGQVLTNLPNRSSLIHVTSVPGVHNGTIDPKCRLDGWRQGLSRRWRTGG